MSTKAEWKEKRTAHLELLSEMYYGKMPGRPQTLTATELSSDIVCQNTVCHTIVRLCAQGEQASVSYNVHVYRPVAPDETKTKQTNTADEVRNKLERNHLMRTF